MNDLEQKRKLYQLLAKIGALLVIGFFAAPVIFLSIKGLAGLIVASALAYTAIHFVPWFSDVVANWRLKAIKHEAAKNPIETLENDYRIKANNLTISGENIKKFGSSVNQYESEVVEFSKKYPDRAATYKMQLDKMRDLLTIRKNKYLEAKKGLKEYELEIDRVRSEWKMSQAALLLAKEAGVSEDDFFNQIKAATALDSVQESLNMAFADLDFCLMEEDDQKKQLSSGNEKLVIDITPTSTKTPIKVN